MGTTLWFTEEDRKAEVLDHLIACGQFTTCYNLLDYLKKLMNKENSPFHSFSSEEKALYKTLMDQLMTDWEMFSSDPFFIIKEQNKRE